jgi:transcriptional regulator with GAF, ATPase, and Fis domain
MTYVREARYAYLRWGADGKVKQLEQSYPEFKKQEPAPGPTSTIAAPVERLDLATVIKVSQAISGEMVLDTLVDRLMRLAIEHAGAERGLLLIPRDGDIQIDAEASSSSRDVIVHRHDAATSRTAVPESIVRYVMRTHEHVILGDASAPNPYSADPYVMEHRRRSILCLPLVKQGKLTAALYLENGLAPHVFTPDRVTVLKVLASQAAVALENARLYRDLEHREAEIRSLKDQLYRENLALRDEVDRASMFEEIVGSSRALKAVLARIAKVGPTDSTVFITGETGTGKELIARALHKRSARSGGAFVSVNCAALAPALISSELFGHEKGAFTGAVQRRLGRFELADGGTLFLDEVGELLPDTQVALLRVLQEREFERVGGTQPIRVDVRLIAATNRDLTAAVATGGFRQDLFYRLNVFPIEVPPLRERKDDIAMLVEYFVQRYASRLGRHFHSIGKKTLDLLVGYDWPGNIRELQNVIERSVILSPGEVFAVDELWLLTESRPAAAATVVPAPTPEGREPRSEREMIEVALAESRGRVSGPSGAAAKLGIPPSTLDHRIKALNINKKRFRFRRTPSSDSPKSPSESPD